LYEYIRATEDHGEMPFNAFSILIINK